MLHAAVHSMNIRPGSAPASSDRTVGASCSPSGRFSAQSPQKAEPPPFISPRRVVIVGPVQTSCTVAFRRSPRTRVAYGSAHPQTMRPSHSMTSISQGHVH